MAKQPTSKVDGKKKAGTANLSRAGMGRPKGSLNKTTAAAKDVISRAAEELGGKDRLVAWAREAPENERAFWATIYPKLLPLEVSASGGFTVHLAKEVSKL